MTEQEIKKTDSWCYCTKQQVNLRGVIVGKHHANLLKVTDCEHKDCPKRYAINCLINKVRE